MKRQLHLFLLVILIGVVTACYRLSEIVPTVEITPTIPSRIVTENNLNLRESWRVPSLLVWADRYSYAYIALTPNHLVLSDTKFGGRGGKLLSFEPLTGSLEWEVEYGDVVNSLVADQNKLYVASAGHPLQSYNLQSGNLLWSGMDLPHRMPYDLDLQNDVLLNYTKGNTVLAFDTESGDLLVQDDRDTLSSANIFLIMQLGEFDLLETPTELLKVQRETGEIIWKTVTNNDPNTYLPAKKFPILSDDKLILMFGLSSELVLYVFDFGTGQLLWKVNDVVVSNAAVSGEKIYVLLQDAKLLALDKATGARAGYIQFTPEETNTDETYWVGAGDQGHVFVYFSDSQELFAFAPS